MLQRLLAILLIQFFLIIPDGDASRAQFDHKTLSHFLNSGQTGVLTAFNGVPEMNGSPLNLSYSLQGNKFEGEFLIVNKTEDDIDLKILALVNNKQVSFELDHLTDSQHFLSLDSQGIKKAKVIFKNLPKGANDLIFVAIDLKGDVLEDSTYPERIYFHRVEVLVDDNSKHKRKVLTAEKNPSLPDKSYFVRLGQKKEYNKKGDVSLVKFQKPKATFYLHVNNPEQSRVDLAVLTFINGKQVYTSQNGSREVDFWQIPANCMGTIPIEVDTKTVKEGDYFMVLYIENPGINLETKNGEMVRQRTRIDIPFRRAVNFN